MPVSALAELPASAVMDALEAAGDAAYVWDLDDDRIDWSGRLAAAGEALAAVFGTGRALAGRIHPDDLGPRQNSLALHLDGAGSFDCEYRLRTVEGGFAWLHERGRAERDAGGCSASFARSATARRCTTGSSDAPAMTS
jgi:PAS domain-containing protein